MSEKMQLFTAKSMNDMRKKMNIIKKIIMVGNNILSSISGQIFNAAAEI